MFMKWIVAVASVSPVVLFGAYGLVGMSLVADAADVEEALTTSDWPMWRFDAQRRSATPMSLDEDLHLQWTLELPAPSRAWPFQHDDRDKLEFDLSYSPIVHNQTLFTASMVNDSLSAFDTRTGRQRWRFYADGPMRLAPVAYDGRVYVVSDDGFLYCLAADTGRVLWRFQGGPSDRRLLGNTRLISAWPARGGPVVHDGRVYFAASVWPLMGTFIHALDAASGEPVWSNTETGALFNLHQHGMAYAYGGVAPQGYLAATDDLLLVSGGRTPPAVHCRATGALKYFQQATVTVGKGAGGYRVAVQDDWFYNHGMKYSLEDGAFFDALDAHVLTDDAVYVLQAGRIVAYASEPEDNETEIGDRMHRDALRERYRHRRLWWSSVPEELDRLHLQAGRRIYASGPAGLVAGIDLPRDDGDAQLVWQTRIDGEVWEMLAADERLFVVARNGAIYCFGGESALTPPRVSTTRDDAGQYPLSDCAMERAGAVLEMAGVRDGYALVFGEHVFDLVMALLKQSDLHVIAVNPNSSLVARMREVLSDLDLYGRRVAVHEGELTDFSLPPYLAELVIFDDAQSLGDMSTATLERLYRVLRPYGGMACIPLDRPGYESFARLSAAAELPGASLWRADPYAVMARTGPLPDTGQWTHQYADAANTVFSADKRTKAPLGVLWFGGPSNDLTLPRHANGPIPQVAAGRLVVLGVDTISARDVYTGRQLWIHELPGIGHPFTDLEFEELYYQGEGVHMSNRTGIGANYIGSPYVSLADAVYVRFRRSILRLDPATGAQVDVFDLPADSSGRTPEIPDRDWGHISVYKDVVISTLSPHIFDDQPLGRQNFNALSSGCLVVMNRHTGELLWQREAGVGFRHNAIIAAHDKVFVIDGVSQHAQMMMERRGILPDAPAVIALDYRTGEKVWEINSDVFGTWLGFSEAHDVLIQSGRPGISGDKRELDDEPNHRITAYRGTDGALLWDRRITYTAPLALRDNAIIPGPQARNDGPPTMLCLLTGDDIANEHPLTGESIPWTYSKFYGCGTNNVSEHLVTFRSGAAGFADLTRNAGTVNLGGFRAGCTNNLVVADGVLNAPDFTRTCRCSYQNQTSLALVHMPDLELWMHTPFERGRGWIERAGINLAAPGSRMADDSTLWIEYPQAGGPAPEIWVRIHPEDAETFQLHSALIDHSPDTGALPWVAGSGVLGFEALEIALHADDGTADESARYTVTLHFIEPEDAVAGDRVFDIRVQNKERFSAFDAAAAAGAPNRPVTVTFSNVEVTDTLHIELTPTPHAAQPPILCGVGLVREHGTPVLMTAM